MLCIKCEHTRCDRFCLCLSSEFGLCSANSFAVSSPAGTSLKGKFRSSNKRENSICFRRICSAAESLPEEQASDCVRRLPLPSKSLASAIQQQSLAPPHLAARRSSWARG